MADNDDYSAQEKASSIAWRIANGQEFTVREVAEDFGITWQGAYRMLNTISRVIPIAPDDRGMWKSFNST